MIPDTRIKHPTGTGVLQFAAFELDLDRGELRVDGRAVPLRPKTYALLALLAQNAGRLVSKDTLMAALWPDVVVTDDSLVQCVTELRSALGAASASLIKTVPRRAAFWTRFCQNLGPICPLRLPQRLPLSLQSQRQRRRSHRMTMRIQCLLLLPLHPKPRRQPQTVGRHFAAISW
jgi:Transcriptional regulatory protein, C terminal